MGNSKIIYYGETLIDLTGDTVEAAKLLKGITAHDKKGEKITGTFEAADPYAIIGVTYPEGSVCTCSNGSVTLTAKDTSGKALFIIPSAGTWTVKAVKGSQSKSKAVSITAEGQVETVVLTYELYLFSGSETWTLKQRIENYGAVTTGNNALTLTGNMGYGGSAPLYACSAFYPSKVAKGEYSTLKVTISSVTEPTDVYLIVQDDTNANPSGQNYIAYVNITEAGTFTLSYPDGSHYVGLSVGGTSKVVASKVWLE
nr:MAG TPA: tail protein [Caudoviricetes sp.]